MPTRIDKVEEMEDLFEIMKSSNLVLVRRE